MICKEEYLTYEASDSGAERWVKEVAETMRLSLKV